MWSILHKNWNMDTLITSHLLDYGTLGLFMIVVLVALYMTVRFIIRTFESRMKEFYDREKKCDERVKSISTRLDDYIDNDHNALIDALGKHAQAYEAQTRTLERLLEKLLS